MQELDFSTLIVMILIVLVLITFWKQFLALLLSVVVAVFCYGLYCLASFFQ